MNQGNTFFYVKLWKPLFITILLY